MLFINSKQSQSWTLQPQSVKSLNKIYIMKETLSVLQQSLNSNVVSVQESYTSREWRLGLRNWRSPKVKTVAHFFEQPHKHIKQMKI